MPETSSARLLHRIHVESGLPIPAGTTIQRTYAGRLQRQTGAWSWFAISPDGFEVCGSHYPVTTLLWAKEIEVGIDRYTGFISVDPIEV